MSWRTLTENLLRTAVATIGEDVLYSPVSGPAYTLRGVFDEVTESIDPTTGAPVIDEHPSLGVKLSDMALPPAKGDFVTIRGIPYDVKKRELDGQGGAVLVLHKR